VVSGRLFFWRARILTEHATFETALTWPEAQQRIQALLKRGLQRDGDFEKRWPALLGTLRDLVTVWQSGGQRSRNHAVACRSRGRRTFGPYNLLGKTFHLLQLWTELQQQQIGSGLLEFRDPLRYPLWRSY
jgi:hypothetical protein